jgi:hypothetical protein
VTLRDRFSLSRRVIVFELASCGDGSKLLVGEVVGVNRDAGHGRMHGLRGLAPAAVEKLACCGYTYRILSFFSAHGSRQDHERLRGVRACGPLQVRIALRPAARVPALAFPPLPTVRVAVAIQFIVVVIHGCVLIPRRCLERSRPATATAAAKEIKSVLGDRLGATLVESSDPKWTRDPEIEAMTTDFRRALARLVPVFMPDLLFRLGHDGQPVFKEFAAAIVPTEFMPGTVFGGGTMKPIDYCVELAEGRIAPPRNLDLATIQQQELAMAFRFHIPQYLSHRAADWKALGFTETLTDFATLNARSKFWGDDQRAAFKNWEEVADPRNPLGGRQGVDERIMLRELLRRVDMMVILENHLDALVRLHTPWPPGLIGGAYQYDIVSNLSPESLSGPNAGLTEVLIPAGYVTIAYDPVFKLNKAATRYVSASSDKATILPEPGLPFSLVFRAEPGKEDILLKIASAYEAASKRRIPPPAFGPLPARSRADTT